MLQIHNEPVPDPTVGVTPQGAPSVAPTAGATPTSAGTASPGAKLPTTGGPDAAVAAGAGLAVLLAGAVLLVAARRQWARTR
jgi:LPXTG-motif cell wall-anchored protein